MLQHFVGINLNSWLSIGQYILSVTLIFLHNKNYEKNFKYLAMYSATGKDVLFLIFLIFAEKNLSFHISSFNESTGFGLLKASPVEFVKYPFSCLQNKILFSKLKYCGLGNTVNGSCLFLSYGTTVPQKSCACTN